MSQLPSSPEETEEPQPPRGHIRVVYLGPVAPHWEVQSQFGERAVIEEFRQRALARLLLLPPHDPQFRRNRERIVPDADRSGSGAGIGPVRAGEGIQLVAVELEGLHGVPAYGIGGPPALAVMAARLGAFGDPPVLVASGVNPGHNTGRSVLHSGTV